MQPTPDETAALPDGTDKVIEGASRDNGGNVTAETTLVT